MSNGQKTKKIKIKRKRIKRFKLLKPIELYALLVTSVLAILVIYLIDGSREYRHQVKQEVTELVYDKVLEIAEREKEKYDKLKKEGLEYPPYDRLSDEFKEAVKKEYNSLKNMRN